MKSFRYYALLAVSLAASLVTAPAQITVSGIANRNYTGYANSAAFTVTLQSGYAGTALLDGQPVPIGTAVTVNKADYHELSVVATNQSTSAVASNLTQFIVYPSERGSTEMGLPPLPLYPMVPSAPQEFAGAQLRIITPDRYPAGMQPPVVIWVVDAGGRAVRVNGTVAVTGSAPIEIKRGVGSGFLATGIAGAAQYAFQIAGLQASKTVTFEDNINWTPISGTLTGAVEWLENSRIDITNHVNLAAGATLTIGAGTVVRVSPVISLTNNGQITISGTVERPVAFAPITAAQPWGGFVQHANNTSFSATGTIFTGAGGYPGYWFGGHGHDPSYSRIDSHREEQALISMSGINNNLTLVDSAAIFLPGQFGHAQGGSSRSYQITLTRFLMQRTPTGGEYTGARFTVNDSAFIECPDTSTNFVDGDNDGLYIVDAPLGAHGFTNTLFGWTKDDGIDSGGDGAGALNFQGCWFEGIFHEANSLSDSQGGSPDKSVSHTDDVFIDCGQALESGYGGPTGRLERCVAVDCMTGARFGDNYNWAYSGRMIATNSILLHNHRDAWGMNFVDWTYRVSNMDIRDNYLTRADPYWPQNTVWDPATHGSLLAPYRGTPANAPVGLGFATWTNRFKLAQITNGVPVRLSIFSPATVTCVYLLRGDGVVRGSGFLTFEAGRMIQWISATNINPFDYANVTVGLYDPSGAEITGLQQVSFETTPPALSLASGSGPLDLNLFASGVPIRLSDPALAGTTVDFEVAGNRVGMTNGTLAIATGATSATLFAPTINTNENDFIQVTLRNPRKAVLAGPDTAYYVRSTAAPPAAPVTLVYRGSRSLWRYRDNGVFPGATWMATNFVDSSWPVGGAPLGYGGGGETTTNYSAVKYFAYYYRHYFTVTNAAGLASLDFNLRRDDGAVVYLNGVKLYSENMPATVLSNTPAVTNISGTPTIFRTTTFAIAALPTPLLEGTNVLAVEIHQQNTGSSDIVFDLEVIGTPTPAPPTPAPLYLGWFGEELTLAWSDLAFRLFESTNVAGPWVTNPANGFYSTPMTNRESYYKLVLP
jgi:hypothetical protein